MTAIYQVGEDEMSELAIRELRLTDDITWCVYDYKWEDYVGRGYAVVYDCEIQMVWVKDLYHNSCDGPCDGGFASGLLLRPDEFLSDVDDITVEDYSPALKAKVRELLSVGVPMTAADAKRLTEASLDEEVNKVLASVYARIWAAAKNLQTQIIVKCPRLVETEAVAAKLKADGFSCGEVDCDDSFTVSWA